MTAAPSYNAFDQPVGETLSGWTPRSLPARAPMVGRVCRVEPLDATRHADTLFRAYAEASDARDWTYLPHDREPDPAAFHDFIAERAASADPLHMAIVCDEEATGAAAFMRIDPANGVLEIGHIHFAPRLQRTIAATESLYLMLRRAFDELRYRRVEWKCDRFNEPSRRAALRLGFHYEGTFRNAVITKGRSRDTAWFAMTDDRWPALRLALETWRDPANFDRQGRQFRNLAAAKGDGA